MPARAQSLGPREQALGGSVAARPSNFAAAENPAALPFGSPGAEEDQSSLELGYAYRHPMLYAQRIADARRVVPTTEPADENILTLGARFDIGKAFGVTGLSVGTSVYLPVGSIFRWSIHPDERPQWLFHTDYGEHIDIRLALAYRPFRWLSLGAGVHVLFDVETFTTARVASVDSTTDPSTGETTLDVSTQLGEEVHVYGRAAPAAGVMLEPIDELRLGIAYRGKIYVDDWGWTRIQGVPASGDLGYVHRFAHYFHPHTVVFAAAVRLHPALWLSVDAIYGHWSEGLTTNHEALGPGRFGNTVSLAGGVSVRVAPPVRLLGGYRYVPSPFDNFGGPTNLLDNDQHIGSLGGEIELGRLEREGLRFQLAWSGRVAFLVEREEKKDPRRFASDRALLENEGIEPYRYGGMVPGASLSVEASW
jgi:hypothetical protein